MKEILLDPKEIHTITHENDMAGICYRFPDHSVIAAVGKAKGRDVYSVFLYRTQAHFPMPRNINFNGRARSRKNAKAACERAILYWFRKSGLKKPNIIFKQP